MTPRHYPSDLTDEEWAIIQELLAQEPQTIGRPATVDFRRVWDAIFYINKTGCQWAYLPLDFPPATTVNYHYLKWMRNGFYQTVNDELRRRVRKKTVELRNPVPEASIAKPSRELRNRP